MCLVTLTSRIESANTEILNYCNMAKADEPTPDRENPMWKTHCEAIADLKKLKDKMHKIDEEQEKKNASTPAASGNVASVPPSEISFGNRNENQNANSEGNGC